ncbi:MAG: hypothetical protein ABJB47_07070 [Actinomycetota bacterium]
MNPRILAQAADQRTAELRACAARSSRVSADRHQAGLTPAHPIRRRTGWALISVGLWLASTGR